MINTIRKAQFLFLLKPCNIYTLHIINYTKYRKEEANPETYLRKTQIIKILTYFDCNLNIIRIGKAKWRSTLVFATSIYQSKCGTHSTLLYYADLNNRRCKSHIRFHQSRWLPLGFQPSKKIHKSEIVREQQILNTWNSATSLIMSIY